MVRGGGGRGRLDKNRTYGFRNYIYIIKVHKNLILNKCITMVSMRIKPTCTIEIPHKVEEQRTIAAPLKYYNAMKISISHS